MLGRRSRRLLLKVARALHAGVERLLVRLEAGQLHFTDLSLLTEASGQSKSELVCSLLTDARLRLCEKEIARGDADAAESWLTMARWNASGEHASRLDSCTKQIAQLRAAASPAGKK